MGAGGAHLEAHRGAVEGARDKLKGAVWVECRLGRGATVQSHSSTVLVPLDDELRRGGLSDGGVHIQPKPRLHHHVPALVHDALEVVVVYQDVKLPDARELPDSVLDQNLLGAAWLGAAAPVDHDSVVRQLDAVDVLVGADVLALVVVVIEGVGLAK